MEIEWVKTNLIKPEEWVVKGNIGAVQYEVELKIYNNVQIFWYVRLSKRFDPLGKLYADQSNVLFSTVNGAYIQIYYSGCSKKPLIDLKRQLENNLEKYVIRTNILTQDFKMEWEDWK